MFSSYTEYEYLLAPIQLVLFMLGMGATLRPADFVGIVLQPRYLFVGAVCQFLLTPMLAVALHHVFGLEPGIAVGLILVSAMPGGQMSKLFTYIARGNVALSITLTAAGTLGSLATVPLLLDLLAQEHLREIEFEMPLGLVMRDVALYLVLPLVIGMTVGRLAPNRRETFSKVCIRVGLVFVLIMIVGSLGSGQIRPASYGWKVPLAIIIFCVGAMQLSMMPFRVMGWPRADAVAVGIEVTMRNMNLALLLKTRLFPGNDPVGNGVLFVILYYAGTALLAGLPLSLRYRRTALRTEAQAAAK